MKAVVYYATISGHSKKIAQAIAKALSITAFNIKDTPPTHGYDLAFIVSGIYSGQCKPELMAFVNRLDSTQVNTAALITSSMKKVPQTSIRNALIANGIAVFDEEYLCQGGFLFMKLSHPNKAEINDAVVYAKKCTKRFCVT